MRTTTLPDGEAVPILGLGTWRMGEDRAHRAAEVKALRTAFELGYRLVDTAEMYGEGGAEQVIGEALAGAELAGDLTRPDLFIVSKVYPHNASRRGVVAACERSLRRLGVDQIDLYLLHWRGRYPLADTVAGFEELRGAGRIRHWGVSNFDVADMEALWSIPTPRHRPVACATDQVYFSMSERGAEFSLLPLLNSRQTPLMAYTPTDQGKLGREPVLKRIAERHGRSAIQVALAWVLSHPHVIAIPKAAQREHLADNMGALDLVLSPQDLEEIDGRFPPPERKTPLAML